MEDLMVSALIHKPMFISFEGIDGSGKSTQIKLLKEKLEAAGKNVDVYREPGGTPVSERIRELLLDPAVEMDDVAELLLFSAARAQLVAGKIRPALNEGRIVICDRFFDSTTAYQGAGRNLGGIDWMMRFHDTVTGGLVPDRTYWLAIPVELGLERRRERSGDNEDRMEKTGAAFFHNVVAAYTELANRYPNRILRLDGTQSVLSLHQQIWDDLIAYS